FFHLVGSAPFEIVDGDSMVGGNKGEVNRDGLAYHLLQADLGRSNPVLEYVEGRIDVSARVEPLINARDLPEARTAAMRCDLHPDVGGGRAQRIGIHSNGKINEPSHHSIPPARRVLSSVQPRRPQSSRSFTSFKDDSLSVVILEAAK